MFKPIYGTDRRGGKMLPMCPNCSEPFYFERVCSWTNRQLYEKRKEREKEMGKG